MAIQEMAELIKELTDIRRDRTTSLKLATEIADVGIMLNQLKIICSNNYKNFEENYSKEYARKVARMQELLSN